MAVATWWCLRVGGEVEDSELPVATITPLPEVGGDACRPGQEALGSSAPGSGVSAAATGPGRLIRVFVRGRTAIINRLLRDRVLVLGRCLPEPWPTAAPAARTRASPAA
jgi:hypothetical protein